MRGILKLSSAATLVGLEAPPKMLNLDIKPYALGAAKADRTLDPTFEADLDGNAGVDVKYGLTRGLTADFTYRTDFAQVEDDDQQVNLTRFSLFFPEKREFFLEGQGIFAFGGVESAPRAGTSLGPVNTPVLFFSRQIGLLGSAPVPIEVGGRLTGKAGRYSVGLLNIQTDDEPDIGASSTNFGVVRLKRDILRRSYIGVIGTSRSPALGEDGTNTVFGIDSGFSFFDSLNMVGYYAQTDTPGLHGKDHSYRARFDYQADRLGLTVEHLGVGRKLQARSGLPAPQRLHRVAGAAAYQPPAGVVAVGPAHQPRVRPRLHHQQRARAGESPLPDGAAHRDAKRRLVERALREQLRVRAGVLPAARRNPGARRRVQQPVRRGRYTLGSQRKISGEISTGHGGFYDGSRTDLAYRGRVELLPQLSLEPGIGVNWIDLPQGETIAKLASVRSTYSFSPAMWVAALLQYNSSPSLFSTNLRFKWEYRPGSDLFVVYSDGRDTVDRFRPALQNRSLAVKVTRLLRVN